MYAFLLIPEAHLNVILTIPGGYCIRDSGQRQRTLAFLHRTRHELQWRTTHLIDSLSRQWAETDSVQYPDAARQRMHRTVDCSHEHHAAV